MSNIFDGDEEEIKKGVINTIIQKLEELKNADLTKVSKEELDGIFMKARSLVGKASRHLGSKQDNQR